MAELGRGDILEAAWRDAVERLDIDLDDDSTVFGVAYNGPDDEWAWTASLERIGSDPPFAPCGWGQTPEAALRALIKAVDHGVGYWPIKRPWDAKSTAWAREEGFG